jgi:triosephosphate isomerase
LRDGLFHIESKDWESIVLAYEPVWAMGQEKQLPEQACMNSSEKQFEKLLK